MQSKIKSKKSFSKQTILKSNSVKCLMGSTYSQDLQHNVENPPMTNYAISFDMLFSYAMLQIHSTRLREFLFEDKLIFDPKIRPFYNINNIVTFR